MRKHNHDLAALTGAAADFRPVRMSLAFALAFVAAFTAAGCQCGSNSTSAGSQPAKPPIGNKNGAPPLAVQGTSSATRSGSQDRFAPHGGN